MINKQGRVVFALLTACVFLTGCLSNLWTGATLLYDRHNVYKKVNDYQLAAKANHALYKDYVFKRKDCSIDLAVFNGDILVTGHVPNQDLRLEVIQRVSKLEGYRRLINQMDVGIQSNNSLEDSWITAKIRGQIFADSEIDPNAFKIITADRVVYLMGDVRPQQANKVIYIARNTDSVERVVKLFKYYNLSKKASVDS